MTGKYINKLIYNRKMKTLEERLESIEESLSAIREKIAPEQKKEDIDMFILKNSAYYNDPAHKIIERINRATLKNKKKAAQFL